jgi:hypothetical protein
MKQVLIPNVHYLVDDGSEAIDSLGRLDPSSPRTVRKGVKLNYWIARVGFYSIRMASSKPRASHYRHQFGEVYEFAINYIQALKNRLIRNLPSTRASEESISLQIKEKANHYKDKLDVANTDIKRLEAETEKLRREVEKDASRVETEPRNHRGPHEKTLDATSPRPPKGALPFGERGRTSKNQVERTQQDNNKTDRRVHDMGVGI